MAGMPKPWVDTKFEVVGNHYRPGERNRDRKLKRWIFTGRTDFYGHPLWYRPPRLKRLGFFLFLCAVTAAAWVLLIAVLWSVQRLRSY